MTNENLSDSLPAKDTLTNEIKRGDESWTYYYIVLAIVLSFEASAIQIANLGRACGLVAHAAVFVITIYVFLTSGWVHSRLSAFRNGYESKFRN
jgi:hypothetical protein